MIITPRKASAMPRVVQNLGRSPSSGMANSVANGIHNCVTVETGPIFSAAANPL